MPVPGRRESDACVLRAAAVIAESEKDLGAAGMPRRAEMRVIAQDLDWKWTEKNS